MERKGNKHPMYDFIMERIASRAINNSDTPHNIQADTGFDLERVGIARKKRIKEIDAMRNLAKMGYFDRNGMSLSGGDIVTFGLQR